ncbi:polysaccharide deacetylase family protein [Aquabacterium sp.]|uniref:polysaccharide deacetylase family protein n=1 Tax=Aquabacterium sp. TaxID=1872578 RepID=UPI0035B1CC6E
MSRLTSAARQAVLDFGLGRQALAWRRSNPLILMYHGVADRKAVPGTIRNLDSKHIPVDAFARQLRVLKRWRKVLPLTDLVQGLIRGDDMRNTVALTFDDGYENNVTRAAPMLADFGMCGTFYLTTGYVGAERWVWNDLLEFVLDQARVAEINVPALGRRLPLGSTERKLQALAQIKVSMKTRQEVEYLDEVRELARQAGVECHSPQDDYRFMSWDQARGLLAGGFEVGAHTVNHPILSRVPIEVAQREILQSRDAIVEQLGSCSKVFCYPNGKPQDYTRDIIEFCRQHFVAALATARGPAKATELFELRRLGPSGGVSEDHIEWCLLRER